MCQSKAEGGLRCAAHTRGPFGRAEVGTPKWEKVAVAYASTAEGAAVMEMMVDQAIRTGDVEREAMFRVVLGQGQQQREVAAEVKSQVRRPGAGSDWVPDGFGFPSGDELAAPFSSPTSRRGLINRMYWENVRCQTDELFAEAGLAEDEHERWLLLVRKETGSNWVLDRDDVLVRGWTGGWNEVKVSGFGAAERALSDVIPTRMLPGQVLLVSGRYDLSREVQLKMQKVRWAQ